MAEPTVKFLYRHLIQHAMVVMDIADQQVHDLYDKKYGDVIASGDLWLRTYAHVPHAMLLDLWSAVAEFKMRNKKYGMLRLIRADMTFRRWERAVKAEGIVLTEGEKAVIFSLMDDFCGGLSNAFYPGHWNGLFELLYGEYQDRIMGDKFF